MKQKKLMNNSDEDLLDTHLINCPPRPKAPATARRSNKHNGHHNNSNDSSGNKSIAQVCISRSISIADYDFTMFSLSGWLESLDGQWTFVQGQGLLHIYTYTVHAHEFLCGDLGHPFTGFRNLQKGITSAWILGALMSPSDISDISKISLKQLCTVLC